jgi:hypothetical protein
LRDLQSPRHRSCVDSCYCHQCFIK